MKNNETDRNSSEIKYAPTKHGVRLIDRKLWDKEEDTYFRSLGQDRWADYWATLQKRPGYEPDNPPRYPWRTAEPQAGPEPTHYEEPEWVKAVKLAVQYAAPDPLEDRPEARSRKYDPDTSQLAAGLVNVPHREQEVIKALAALFGQGSNEDIANYLNEKYGRTEIPSNISPRIAPLRRKGLVEYSGKTKKSRQGQANRIWALTELGWTVVKMLDEDEECKAA